MEQVKRYSPDDPSAGEYRNPVMDEDPQGDYVQYEDYTKLSTDHARCVQDVRRMARMVQQLTDDDTGGGYYQDAQRVLETWKEGM